MKKRVNKKGAMELSMNTIVIVVIGITLLVLGLVFVRGIFTKLTGLGGSAFQKAEQELKQIQAGDTKINFPATIEIKKGKSSNPTLRICNTDGTLTSPSVDLEAFEFPAGAGLSVRVGSQVLSSDGKKTVSSSTVGEVTFQNCRPFPVLVNTKPGVIVNPNEQPFLAITVKSGANIYDSIGTTITIT
ncbi:MAG: hypothetical protein ISS23_00215 [Nanoarchaeota archaeon]|nr:hypothetical protein [Nanoarchaeota archaeon]